MTAPEEFREAAYWLRAAVAHAELTQDHSCHCEGNSALADWFDFLADSPAMSDPLSGVLLPVPERALTVARACLPALSDAHAE